MKKPSVRTEGGVFVVFEVDPAKTKHIPEANAFAFRRHSPVHKLSRKTLC